MTTEVFGHEFVERYLRTRRVRYFRGQHDGEYFYIQTAAHDRLHIHLEISRERPSILTIRVTPAYFFPATHRVRLLALAGGWNRQDEPARAIVYESSDPNRIGVIAENARPLMLGITFEDFANVVDQTIESAIRLLGELTHSAQAGTPDAWVPDAS